VEAFKTHLKLEVVIHIALTIKTLAVLELRQTWTAFPLFLTISA